MNRKITVSLPRMNCIKECLKPCIENILKRIFILKKELNAIMEQGKKKNLNVEGVVLFHPYRKMIIFEAF